MHVVPIRAAFKAVHFGTYELGWREDERGREGGRDACAVATATGDLEDTRRRGGGSGSRSVGWVIGFVRLWSNVAIKNGPGDGRAGPRLGWY